MKKSEINVFIFRRDYRLDDNTSLYNLIDKSLISGIKIIPIFIFNPKQIDSDKNQYFNKNCIEFMVQCLKSLNLTLKDRLYYFYGTDIEILNKLLTKFQINTLAFNCDYTPYARHRDSLLQSWCQEKDIELLTNYDYNLIDFSQMMNGSGKAYEIFTPFYNKLLLNVKYIRDVSNKKIDINIFYDDEPNKLLRNLIVKDIDKFYNNNSNKYLNVIGSRENALKILTKIKKNEFANYEKYRDYPYMDKTTKLSAYIKFGCVSIREVFWTIRRQYGIKNGLLREVLWKEFYSHVTYNYPKILSGQIQGRNHTFKEKYNNLRWSYNEKLWNSFIQGKTGVPFVDAGIRQMLTTGWMHNRLRMVVGQFIAKDLMFDWKLFENWMASNLIDYDPSSNSGGVHWCYSTGSDSQPYFRIFNPYLQSIKYDPDAKYIKKWVSELKDVPVKAIHEWNDQYKNYPGVYYIPICDHKVQSEKAINMFK